MDRNIVLLVGATATFHGHTLGPLQVDDQRRRQLLKGYLLCHPLSLLLVAEQRSQSLLQRHLRPWLQSLGLGRSCQAGILCLLALAAFLRSRDCCQSKTIH